MAKRFTDTEKYKKPFFRGLPGAYKLLWDYLYHTCDHAGIWIVDFEIAQIYLGADTHVNRAEALTHFNQDETRIIELDAGKKWFIAPFIEFQYGELNPNNNLHKSVIRILRTHGLINDDFSPTEPDFFENNENQIEPLNSPSRGAQYKGTEKDKEKDKDRKGGMGGNQIHSEANRILLHLRDTSGREFSPGMANTRHIIARLEEGHPPEDLINVIDLKVWQSTQHRKDGDLVFKREWLAPNTLFRKDQFEKYLNEVKEIQNGTADANPYQHPTKARAGRIKNLYEELGIDPLEGFGFAKSSGEDGADIQPGHTIAGATTS